MWLMRRQAVGWGTQRPTQTQLPPSRHRRRATPRLCRSEPPRASAAEARHGLEEIYGRQWNELRGRSLGMMAAMLLLCASCRYRVEVIRCHSDAAGREGAA